ncbi:hypothetical protein HAX54_023180 [Datura stramonium]|uniref:Uncharacterized protein n=1 Tax=Datura stramonium TaxID=4076 RepID=A0ABS8UW33_DATST|nr:hypothetical protein [Datura stramonium]
MEDISEHFLFNEGMHTTSWARILISKGPHLSIPNNEELKAQISFQELEILALKDELAKRMEELVSTGYIANLKAEIEKPSKNMH